MRENSLVSVIMPVYNRESKIANSINSVIAQSYENFELIIIDDHSTDNTKGVIEGFSNKDSRIKYFSNNGLKGVAATRNVGLKVAKGKYIAFLDSDDLWSENHLKRSIEVLDDLNLKVCFSFWVEEDLNGNLKYLFDEGAYKSKLNEAIKNLNADEKNNSVIFNNPDFLQYSILAGFYCTHINTLVLERDVLEEIGMFDECLRASEDDDFEFNIFCKYKFALIKEYHFTYKQGEDNIYNFIDRKNYDLEKLMTNKKVVERVSICLENKTKALTKEISNIKAIEDLKENKLCVKKCCKKLGKKYFTLGFLNSRTSKLKSLKYGLLALKYSFSLLNIKLIIHIIFPHLFSDVNYYKKYMRL